MAGLSVKKFTISSEMVDSLQNGENPSAADLDKAISDSEEGDSDG